MAEKDITARDFVHHADSVSLPHGGSLFLAVAAKKANRSENEFKTRMCEQDGAGKS